MHLANDVATGKKSAKEARAAFGQVVTDDVLGKHPAYVTSLQFALKGAGAPDADVPVIPGAPRRAPEAGRDATTLGTLVAIDMNEVLAAMVATEKKPSPAVMAYAKMLHEAHGLNLTQTLKLGKTLKVAPGATPETDRLSLKGAKELAALVPLTGERFETAFLAAMVKGHTEVLQVVDRLRAEEGQPDALKQHLDMTRNHVATHRDAAKKLQANLRRPQAKTP